MSPSYRHVNRVSAWPQVQVYLIVLSIISAVMAGVFWVAGAVEPLASVQMSCLVVAILTLNFAPLIAEFCCRRLDPLDAKHSFLAYYFLVFTLHSVYAAKLGGVINSALLVPEPSATLRIRALAAILLGLAAFVAGCYLQTGKYLARLLPARPALSGAGTKVAIIGGFALGIIAFYLLMAQAGGLVSFLRNLGTWRTVGVIEGVGYLTFPISIVMPAAALLLLLYTLPPAGQRLTWPAIGALLLALASLGPIIILGFRGSVLPALLQFMMAWHYFRRRFSFTVLLMLGSALLVLLTFYALARNDRTNEPASDYLTAVLFRVPGLDFVERVVWRLDLGEPYRGVGPTLKEAGTILVPRALWINKPEAGSLAFADIFFYDVFLSRGDPIGGIRSGVSPTLIGETLWIGGMRAVFLAGLVLGILARTAANWRQRGGRHQLHVFSYAIFMSLFPIFVEAPQNALNGVCMVTVMAAGVYGIVARKTAAGRKAALIESR